MALPDGDAVGDLGQVEHVSLARMDRFLVPAAASIVVGLLLGAAAIFGITLMVLAALLAATGGNALSRAVGADGRAMMGMAPENEGPSSGAALAPVGVFLFVCVPVFVVGGLVYGTG